MIKITNPKKFIMINVAVLAILAIAAMIFFHFRSGGNSDPAVSKAGKEGKKVEMKLLVQIAPPPTKGRTNPEERFKRGDIVLTALPDAEFSRAEKEGFLIIKVKINEAQAALITAAPKSAQAELDQKENEIPPLAEKLPRRRYAVDLAQIGIAPDDFQGREINDKIYGEEIIVLK